MRVGSLNKLFSLQEGKVSGSETAWNETAAVWGKIGVVSEEMPVRDLSRRISHAILVRYRSDVVFKTGMRLVHGNRVFMIRSVLDLDEAKRWLKLLVEETVFLD